MSNKGTNILVFPIIFDPFSGYKNKEQANGYHQDLVVAEQQGPVDESRKESLNIDTYKHALG